ncbi:DNA cytosine methyltransferase [Dyadobacter helix]
MRMLYSNELLKIQGFSEDYVLLGSDSDKKKFIGNSISPIYVQRWIETFGKAVGKSLKQEAA